MGAYILIIAFYAGTLSNSDSVSLATAEFTSQKTCEAAGEAYKSKFGTMKKTSVYVCVAK